MVAGAWGEGGHNSCGSKGESWMIHRNQKAKRFIKGQYFNNKQQNKAWTTSYYSNLSSKSHLASILT